jgi:hypothetical protein
VPRAKWCNTVAGGSSSSHTPIDLPPMRADDSILITNFHTSMSVVLKMSIVEIYRKASGKQEDTLSAATT